MDDNTQQICGHFKMTSPLLVGVFASMIIELLETQPYHAATQRVNFTVNGNDYISTSSLCQFLCTRYAHYTQSQCHLVEVPATFNACISWLMEHGVTMNDALLNALHGWEESQGITPLVNALPLDPESGIEYVYYQVFLKRPDDGQMMQRSVHFSSVHYRASQHHDDFFRQAYSLHHTQLELDALEQTLSKQMFLTLSGVQNPGIQIIMGSRIFNMRTLSSHLGIAPSEDYNSESTNNTKPKKGATQ